MLFFIAGSVVALVGGLRLASWLVSLVETPAKSDDSHPPLSRTLSFAAGVVTSLLVLLISTVHGIFASIALAMVGKGGLSQWAAGRFYCFLMGITTGIWFVVQDEDEDGDKTAKTVLSTTRPAVFIGNHQSELDVTMLGRVFPRYCSMTAKKSLAKTPFLGQFMTLSNTVFLDRRNRDTSVKALQGATDAMVNKHQSVYLFPEGTRSHTTEPTMLEFKTGAFHMASDADVPIVPIVVANYSAVFNIKKRIFRPGRIPVTVMKPVAAPKKDEIYECIKHIRAGMTKTLIKLDSTMREWNPDLYAATSGSTQSQQANAALATGIDSQDTGKVQSRQ